MRTVIILPILLAAAAGCSRSQDKAADLGRPADAPRVAETQADNTERNKRDREPSALTPGDQGENQIDLSITQKIRQEVVKDDMLSSTAKNIKIITRAGVVTLRGPVKSDKEKSAIAVLAQRVDGVQRVDNQLETAAD